MICNDYNVDDTYQEFTYIQFLVYMYLITRPYCTKLEKIITIFKLDALAVLFLKNCYTPIFILSFFFKYKNNFAALKGGGRRWNNKNNSYFIQNRCITAELFLRIV